MRTLLCLGAALALAVTGVEATARVRARRDVKTFALPLALPFAKGTKEAAVFDFDPRLPDPPCVWTAWSKCDAACNGGSAWRKRRITAECSYGPDQQLKTCNTQPCLSLTFDVAPSNPVPLPLPAQLPARPFKAPPVPKRPIISNPIIPPRPAPPTKFASPTFTPSLVKSRPAAPPVFDAVRPPRPPKPAQLPIFSGSKSQLPIFTPSKTTFAQPPLPSRPSPKFSSILSSPRKSQTVFAAPPRPPKPSQTFASPSRLRSKTFLPAPAPVVSNPLPKFAAPRPPVVSNPPRVIVVRPKSRPLVSSIPIPVPEPAPLPVNKFIPRSPILKTRKTLKFFSRH